MLTVNDLPKLSEIPEAWRLVRTGSARDRRQVLEAARPGVASLGLGRQERRVGQQSGHADSHPKGCK